MISFILCTLLGVTSVAAVVGAVRLGLALASVGVAFAIVGAIASKDRGQAISFVDFAENVLGVKFTKAQRVLALVCFDDVQPAKLRRADRKIFETIFGPIEHVPPAAQSLIAIVKGARAGGSYLCSLFLLYRALIADVSSLAPGEIGVALAVAPDQRLARLLVRYALGAAKSVSSIARLIATEGADGFTLLRADGVTVSVEALPASRGGASLRGRTLLSVVLDESNFFRDDSGSYEVTDRIILDAVLPRVVPGGKTTLCSTPFVEAGVLFELFKSEHGAPKTALVAHCPTERMRDDKHTLQMVARERQRDPKNAAREYDALFISPAAALVSWPDIQRCVAAKSRFEPTTNLHAIGGDVGLRRDRTAFAVTHRELRSRPNAPPIDLIVVDAIEILKPGPLAPVMQAQRVSLDDVESAALRLAKKYPTKVFAIDKHYFDEIAPRLTRRKYKVVEASVSPAAQEKRASILASRIENGTILLPNHPELLGELKSIRITRHAGGRVTIGAPNRKGAHDDIVDALLNAVEQAVSLPAGGDVKCDVRVKRDGPHVELIADYYVERTDPHTGAVYREPSPPPMGTPAFDRYAHEMIMKGMSTPEIDAWQREQGDGDNPSPLNVPVVHDDGRPAFVPPGRKRWP